MDDSKYDNIFSRLENEHDLERPKNRTYIYAMTEENIDKYMDNEYYSGFYTPGEAVSLITILMAAVAIAAFLYPFLKSLNTGNELVFRAPFEAVAIVFGMMAATLGNNCGYMFIRNEGRVMFIDVLCWIVIFGIVYWTAGCLRQVFTLGGKRYVKERTFLVPSQAGLRHNHTARAPGLPPARILKMWNPISLAPRIGRHSTKGMLPPEASALSTTTFLILLAGAAWTRIITPYLLSLADSSGLFLLLVQFLQFFLRIDLLPLWKFIQPVRFGCHHVLI